MKPTQQLPLALAAAGLAITFIPVASAQIIWNGSSNTSWQTGANWNGGNVPTSAQTARFSGVPTANQPSNGTSGQAVNKIEFGTSTGGWTLSGSTLNVGAGGIDSQGTSGTNTMSARVTVTADQSVNVNSGGSLTLTNGIGGGAFAVTKTGAGTLTLSTTSHTGTGLAAWNFNGGVVSVDALSRIGNNASGNTALNFNGGTLRFTGSNANIAGTRFAATGNTLGVSGGTIDVTTSGQSLGFNTALSGSGGLTKTGVGDLSLGGVNTYTGNTTVSAGSLTFASGGETRFVIGANGVNNSVGGAGSAAFNGLLRIDLSGASIANGNSWTLVDVSTLNESFGGTFSVASTSLGGFTNNSGVWSLVDGVNTWQFSQSTGVLSLTAIPEPSAFAAFAGLATLGFAATRRRRA